MASLEQEFIDMISREPDEPVHRMAYHDWLVERGTAWTGKVNKLEDLRGRVLTAVKVVGDPGRELVFTLEGGGTCKLYHRWDCCESVGIEDVCGDLQDLIGLPLLLVEESSNRTDPPHEDHDKHGTYTWTFYRFATVKGYVTIRWYGESNGYYSESVDFEGEKAASRSS